jgi:two-component system, NarL family, nitrate/nitrite response regulator NarL
MEHASPIRLAFVDDHPTLLRGLATIFGSDGRYTIAATGASAEEAVTIARAGQAQILILDLSMPGDVFTAISEIVDHEPTLKLIVFTAFANVELALKALDAGAHAFVLKGRPSEDLNDAIDAVLRGDLYVSPEFSQRLVAGFRNRTKRDALATIKLSAREQQLVELLLQAKSNKEIARSLQLTEKTVKHYMTNLMNKLQVKSRLEVVLAAQAAQRHESVFEFDETQK